MTEIVPGGEPRTGTSDRSDEPVDRARVLSGVRWVLLQKWSVRLAALLTFVVLGRLLEPREFGVVALASVVVSLTNVFSEVGFATYIVQARRLDNAIISTIFWSGVVLSTLLTAGLIIAAAPLSALLGAPQMALPLAALSAVIILTALSSTQTALLKRQLAFRSLAARSLLATFVSCAVAIALALGGAGIWALVGQSITFSATSAIALWSLGGWRPSMTLQGKTAREVLRYGSTILLITLLGRMRRSGDALVVGAIAGPTVLGFFVIASKITEVLLDTATSVVSSVASPVFARLKDDLPRLQATYVAAVTLTLAVIAPALSLAAASSPTILPLLFGPAWADSVRPAQALTLAAIVTTMVHFDRGLMIALDRRMTELAVGSATVTAGLVGIAVAALWGGLVAIAMTVLLRTVLAWPFRLRLTTRALGLPTGVQAWTLTRILGAAAIGTAPAWIAGWQGEPDTSSLIRCLVASLLSAVVYLLALRLICREVAVQLLIAGRSAVARRGVPPTLAPATKYRRFPNLFRLRRRTTPDASSNRSCK